MAKKTKKAAKVAKPAAGKLKSGVYVAASLDRDGTPVGKSVYDSYVEQLYLNDAGEVMAKAACGTRCFVCTKAEAPTFADFLTKIADAKTAA